MRDDLQGLEITQRELQILTNLPVNNELIIIIYPIKRLVKDFIEKVKGSEGVSVVFIVFSVLFFSYVLFDSFLKVFATSIKIPSWILLTTVFLSCVVLAQIFLILFWRQRKNIVRQNMTNSLKTLLKDVNRHNAVIKAININDQIEEAGNPGVSVQDREKVIEALKITRSDLVRALKTERILREHHSFIIRNTELFADNLANLTAMQVTEEATEHGRLLNEALQIALDVQDEMRNIQKS